MRFFTVHLKSDADPALVPDRGAVLVKEGFNWPAFLFGFLWALANRMWIVAAALFGVSVVLNVLVALIGFDQASGFAITFGFRLWVGFNGNDLRRWTLGRSGYEEFAVVAAADRLAAERRFFDAYPELPAPAPAGRAMDTGLGEPAPA